jgi:hypothetical protein
LLSGDSAFVQAPFSSTPTSNNRSPGTLDLERKTAIGCVSSFYTNSQFALLIRQENSDIVSHPFPQKTRKWMGHPDSI